MPTKADLPEADPAHTPGAAASPSRPDSPPRALPTARRRHVVAGRVQGVGFRPFVYRLALDNGLAGFVQNTPEGVVIEVQGPAASLDAFDTGLTSTLPPLALLVEHERTDIEPNPAETAFIILKSQPGEGHHVLISPDIATCPDCLADMADPDGRRAGYPFTNCTNCGPRYTITKDIPYDRDKTSMACFPLCPECAREYEDPLDRRFHAQPNACPVCGPHVWLADAYGKPLAEGAKAVEAAAKALAKGRILALKGLGGFHLAVDAFNHKAVARLRARKRRPAKPLAVMVADSESLAVLADATDQERAMLAGRERPIVLVSMKPDGPLSPDVSPDTDQLGVMLPYTPLHHVLLAALARLKRGQGPTALVMTSGNASSEPICLGNREALARLKDIADVYLLHNRDILVRTDDSVVRFGGAGMEFLRRARGFTPSPVFLAAKGPCVLGVGPELKNTVCLTKGDQAFVSQHIGDMQNLATQNFHAEVADHLRRILKITPEAVVADMHPDYLSTRYALQSGLPVFRLQHHFAHILALAAEHRITEPVLGLAMDGSGLGADGTIWGGEFLYADPMRLDLRRLGSLSPVLLPGGEAAIRHPWRMAQAYCHAAGDTEPGPHWTWRAGREHASDLVAAMLRQKVNSPTTTSCGRLFDAVSAMLGLCASISYEGQAAILLEKAQDFQAQGAYPCALRQTDTVLQLDTLSLFTYAAREFAGGIPVGTVSRRFHLGLAQGMAEMAAALAERCGARLVGLSGGVFLNRTLSELVRRAVQAHGLQALAHVHTPPGDGCISLGQAFYGQRILAGVRPTLSN